MLARRSLLGGLVTWLTPSACSRPDPVASSTSAVAPAPSSVTVVPGVSSTARTGSVPHAASAPANVSASSAATGAPVASAPAASASVASARGTLRVMRQEEVAGVATVTWLRTAKDQDAVLVVPSWGPGPWPLLVALHGLGEARKGGERGAHGWVRDYNLVQAIGRLHAPPLRPDDLQSIYDARRMAELNQRLAQHPFEGLAVLCPYTPDLLQERSLDNAEPFADHLVATWLPGVRAFEPRLRTEREHTGLDGVSLGGRVALLAGLRHSEAFGALGSLQAALQMNEARPLARRVAAARKQGSLPLRLLTSERDFYRDEIRALHRELEKIREPHEHVVVPGPHDYPFNRGPGAIEMLMWHDRKLRGG